MKNTKLLTAAALAGAIALSATAAAQEVVYSKVAKLEIRQSASAASAVVATVPKGEPLTVLSESRFRFEVQTRAGQQGFVSRLQVTDDAPSGGRGGLGGLVRDDRSPEEMRSAAAGRGLAEEAENLAGRDGVTEEDVEAAREMEERALAISDAEVDAFMREGGLAG